MHSTASSSSSQRPLFININAGVLLENGKAWNIRKVSRHADACMILEGNVLRFYGFLMIDKVDVSTLRVCKAFSGLSGGACVCGFHPENFSYLMYAVPLVYRAGLKFWAPNETRPSPPPPNRN